MRHVLRAREDGFMMEQFDLLLAIIGLWIPITMSLINIALKFGKLVTTVEQMRDQQKHEATILDDLVIRLTKVEVILNGQV